MKKLTRGRIAAIIAAAVLAVAALVVGIVLANRSNYVLRGDVLTLMYDHAYNKTATMYNNKVIWDDGFYCQGYVKAYTVDLAGDAIMAYNEKNGSLYHFSVSGVKAVSSDVANFVMSDDGRRFAWVSAAGKMQVFNGASVKDVTETGNLYNFAMSPKGKYLLYVAPVGGKDTMMLYSAADRRSVRIREGMLPLSVDDDAKYIYCVDGDGALCCLDANGRTINTYRAFTGKEIFLNTDHTQIVFGDEDGLSFAVVRGGEAHQVGTNGARPLLPEYCAFTYTVTTADSLKVYTFGVREMSGCVYIDGERLSYVDDGFNVRTIADRVEDASLSDNGRTLYYISNSTLYRTSGGFGGSAMIEEGVSRVYIVPDGSSAYYITTDKTLRHSGSSSAGIAEGCVYVGVVRGGGAMYMTDYNTDEFKGSLYYTGNAQPGRLLTDKCYDCWTDMAGSYYIVGRRVLENGDIDYDVTLYGGPGGTFDELYKDVWDIQNYTFTY